MDDSRLRGAIILLPKRCQEHGLMFFGSECPDCAAKARQE